MAYALKFEAQSPVVGPDEFALAAVGDLRDSANVVCWPKQMELEENIMAAFRSVGLGEKLKRAHGLVQTPEGEHGFLSSAKMGDDLRVHPDATYVIASASWAYTHHILEKLRNHKGKILLLGNDSGTWPGIVFLLQLRASLTKLGKEYQIAWGNDLTLPIQEYFSNNATIKHDTSHVMPFEDLKSYFQRYEADMNRGREAARYVKDNQLFRMGIFDEYCMGMFAAVIEDSLLPPGVTKERLSQSALHAEIETIPDETVQRHRRWLFDNRMRFIGEDGGLATLISTGIDDDTHLTERQILRQLAAYDAGAQIADAFGCRAIGVQYQQGLKDLEPASDLEEGLWNASKRPPIFAPDGRELFKGLPLIHFNEVDECAGLDAMMTNLIWRDLHMQPDTSLHDARWIKPYRGNGIEDKKDIHIWEISGSVPPTWNIGGYGGTVGHRQPSMYFKKGGSTVQGVTKPGEIVWSRIYTEGRKLHMDIGRGGVVELPPEETERRLNETTKQWPISHVVTYGVTKNQFLAQHKGNHVNMVYADNAEMANRGLFYKATMAQEMGIEVHVCGDINMTLDKIQPPQYRKGTMDALPYKNRLLDMFMN